jgi:hypothetical protein
MNTCLGGGVASLPYGRPPGSHLADNTHRPGAPTTSSACARSISGHARDTARRTVAGSEAR